jgi:hypothetical protein
MEKIIRMYTSPPVSSILKYSIKGNCLVNISNKHLIKPNVLLIYDGLGTAREGREGRLMVGGEAEYGSLMAVEQEKKVFTWVKTRREKLSILPFT